MRKIFLFICMLGLFASLLGNQSGLSNSYSLKENSPDAEDPSFVGTLAAFYIDGALYTWLVNVTDVYAGPVTPGNPVRVQYDTSWGCSPDYDTSIPDGAYVSVFGFYDNGIVSLCQSGSPTVYHIRDVGGCWPPPGTPQLASPSDNENITDTTPAFTWNATSNATKYELWVSAASDFSAQLNKYTTDSPSHTLTKSLANGVYYWRVRGRHIVGDCNLNGPFSAVRSFTIGPDCSTPGAPALSAPANGSTTSDNTPTFSWNTVSNATTYELQVDNNSDFSSPVLNPTPSGSSYTPSSTLANGTYYWRVRGHNGSSGCNVDGPWSSVRTVTINTCNTPGAPTLSAPANGSATSDSTPTFSWNTTSYATEYQLQVDNNSDFSSPVLNPSLPGTSFTPASSLPFGTYYWRVRGHNAGAGCDVYGNTWSDVWAVILSTDPTVEPSSPPVVTETSTPPPDTTPTPNPPKFVYVPMNLLLNKAGFWEQEDNGDYLSANGPVPSGQTAFGYLNDKKDYFYFTTNRAGPITVSLDRLSGQKVQLQLFYQLADSGHLKTYSSKPPYQLSHWGDPGRYYIYIANVSESNNSAPYTLAVSYP